MLKAKRFFALGRVRFLWAPFFIGVFGFLGACSTKPTVVEPAPLQAIEDPLRFEVHWKKDVGTEFSVGAGRLAPLVLGDKILIADGKSRVRALSITQGREHWSTKFDRDFGGGMSGDNAQLFFATLDGSLHLLDTHTGEPVWAAQASSEVVTPAAMSGRWVVVQSVDGRVQAFDRTSAALRWQYQANPPLLTLRGNAPPQIIEDQVIAAFADGSLVALDLETGLLNWQRFVALPNGRTELERLVDVDGVFTVSGSVVYAVSFQGNAIAVDLYSGDTLWEKALSSVSGLAAYGSRIFVVDDQSHVWSLNGRDGQVSWAQTELQFRGLGSPVIVGDYLVISDNMGYVHWLDPMAGTIRGRKRLGKSRLNLTTHTVPTPNDEAGSPQQMLISFSNRAKLRVMTLK